MTNEIFVIIESYLDFEYPENSCSYTGRFLGAARSHENAVKCIENKIKELEWFHNIKKLEPVKTENGYMIKLPGSDYEYRWEVRKEPI